VGVIGKGGVVEGASARSIFTTPVHRYTRKLMRATPRPGVSLRDLLPEEDGAPATATVAKFAPKDDRAPLLVVQKLVKEYPRKSLDGFGGVLGKFVRRGPAPEPDTFQAVDGVSFTVRRGESVGLVGESGCGKSTTSPMVIPLIHKTAAPLIF